jgi:hypothetical protein
MVARLIIAVLLVSCRCFAGPPPDSVEVTLESTPEQHQPSQAETEAYNRWKRDPREADSDTNYDHWRYQFVFTASDKRLGSARDVASIKQLLPGTVPPTMRWVSRSLVVALSACYSDSSPTVRSYCLYIFEKHGSKWKLTHHYYHRRYPWVGSNPAIQPTAGARTASLSMINTRSFETTLAVTSGG